MQLFINVRQGSEADFFYIRHSVKNGNILTDYKISVKKPALEEAGLCGQWDK